MNAFGGDSMFGFRMPGSFENRSSESSEETAEEKTETEVFPLLHITGGTIYVTVAGDGLDSNGDIIIDGGDIIVNGPSDGANGALDSGSESGGDLRINGGTIIALGSSGMAENFSENSSQYSFHCTFNSNFKADERITITDSNGTEIYSYTAKKAGNSIVFSSPLLAENETYIIKAGEQTQEMQLTAISNGSGFSFGGMFGRR